MASGELLDKRLQRLRGLSASRPWPRRSRRASAGHTRGPAGRSRPPIPRRSSRRPAHSLSHRRPAGLGDRWRRAENGFADTPCGGARRGGRRRPSCPVPAGPTPNRRARCRAWKTEDVPLPAARRATPPGRTALACRAAERPPAGRQRAAGSWDTARSPACTWPGPVHFGRVFRGSDRGPGRLRRRWPRADSFSALHRTWRRPRPACPPEAGSIPGRAYL